MDKSIGCISMERMDNREYNSVGSSRIRVRWLLPFWEEAEEFIVGKKYEVHLYQKVYWAAMMKAFDGVKILDLADPDWLENKPVFEYIDLADAVVTSTEALADYIRKLRPNAFVCCVPDRVLLSEAVPIKEDYGEQLQSLVWFGYSQNTHYLHNTFDELIKRGLELTVISDQTFIPPLVYRSKLKLINLPYSYSTVNREIIKHDAVLMPSPTGDERAKFKSNNKVLQSQSLGMPIIRLPEDFDRLMTKEAREQEGKANRKLIEEKYDVKQSVEEYREIIRKIKEKKGV